MKSSLLMPIARAIAILASLVVATWLGVKWFDRRKKRNRK
mgnify:CR=1 FL=1